LSVGATLVVPLSLSLLVEVSRLSSPLTGRVEILNIKEERRAQLTPSRANQRLNWHNTS
jgi:hypothetical protein